MTTKKLTIDRVEYEYVMRSELNADRPPTATINNHDVLVGSGLEVVGYLLKPKEETEEEAAKRIAEDYGTNWHTHAELVIAGIQWQKEQEKKTFDLLKDKEIVALLRHNEYLAALACAAPFKKNEVE